MVVAKEGPGRLYYRVAMVYSPSNMDIEPVSNGFTVTRNYETVDKESTIEKLPTQWKVNKGTVVKVTVTMVIHHKRYNIALVDNMPAGFEIEKKTNEKSQWWEHVNYRDDRVEVFAIVLEPGTYTFDYTARTTSVGTFNIPPARAEEMYT